MKVGIIGAVSSTYYTLEKLIEHGLDVMGVWGYEPESVKNVSDYCSLRELSAKNKLKYYPFVKVNDNVVKEQIKDSHLDVLFIVGLSQLVDSDILKIPMLGCVGFHPTKLPLGRGRAPVAWLVMEGKQGAANFFKLDESADSGEIYVQEVFDITPDDDATSVEAKLKNSMIIALDRWLPELKKGILIGVKQDETKATYYARRAPLDGFIDWYWTVGYIDRVVKASTDPHPGAYTFYEDNKVRIWKCHIHKTGFPIGVVGRIVAFSNSNPVVQASDGYVELEKYDFVDTEDNIVNGRIVVGSRLGYYDQYEIFKLKNDIKTIKQQLGL